MKKFILNIEEETFKELREKFNLTLKNILYLMDEKETDVGLMNIKIEINMREWFEKSEMIKSPTFKYSVTSSIQEKTKSNGIIYGKYQLMMNGETGNYELIEIPDKQVSMEEYEEEKTDGEIGVQKFEI